MTVLHRVREVRLRHGLTQSQLADLLNLQTTDICKLERRVRDPRLSTLKSVAQALKVTLDELMG